MRCDMIDVGKNIRRFRVQKKLTQDALAEKLHVTRQAVSNWETGKNQPDLEMLEAMAKALDLELAVLLQGRGGKYQRFQVKAIVWVIALGILSLFLLTDELFLAPWLLALRRKTYNIWPYAFNDLAVLPICRLAAGMLVPAVVSLWHNVQPEGKIKTVLRIAPFFLLIPTLLTMLFLAQSVWPPLSRFAGFVMSDSSGIRLRLVCRVFPFLAGLCLYPAFVRLRKSSE